MCLAIPGKVVEFHRNHGVRMSKVDFGGITREACLEYLPDVSVMVLEYIWKNAGWGTIIFLAAISKIEPYLYEAAVVDGAGPWRRMWHITLPGIMLNHLAWVVLSVCGIRVFLNTHAPLTLPGTLSTAGHCDQSKVANLPFLLSANCWNHASRLSGRSI